SGRDHARRGRRPARARPHRAGAARGAAADRARGHDLRRREPRARHSDRHRDVAPVARARAPAPRHGRRARHHAAAHRPMTEDEDRVANADQNALLRRRFDPVLTEPIPARMYLQPPLWIDHARAAAWVVLGIAIGLMVPYLGLFSSQAPAVAVAAPLPVRAARAHLVYTPEVRHPVEVDAKEKDHLVKWLSKRLDRPLKVPALGNEGFELLGGRLLPGNDGPVAQF